MTPIEFLEEYKQLFPAGVLVYARGQVWQQYVRGAKNNIVFTADGLRKYILNKKGTDFIIPVDIFELLAYLQQLAIQAEEQEKQEKQEEKEALKNEEVINVYKVCSEILEKYEINPVTRTFTETGPDGGLYEITREGIVTKIVSDLNFAIPKTHVEVATTQIVEDLRRIQVQKVRDKVAYDPAQIPIADEVVKYFFEFYGIEDTPENTVMLKHWFWHLKRSIFGLPKGRLPIFLVLVGQGKIGKSSFIQRGLKEVLEGGIREMALGDLRDPKAARAMLSGAFAMEFPDMDLAEEDPRSLNELMKRLIDADYVTTREHGQMVAGSSRVTCAMYGNANRPLPEIIYDHTGMRRYWEMRCTTKLEIANRIQESEELWQGLPVLLRSINEQDVSGYWDTNTQVGKNIVAAQAQLVKQDLIEAYFIDMDVLPLARMYSLPGETPITETWSTRYDSIERWRRKGNFRWVRSITQAKDFVIAQYGTEVFETKKAVCMFSWVKRSEHEAKLAKVSQQQTLNIGG